MERRNKIRPDLRTYIVETGSYEKTIEAGSLEAAVESAFILWPPKEPGVLTRVKAKHPPRKKRKEGLWHYIDTIIMLKKAGYKVYPPQIKVESKIINQRNEIQSQIILQAH